MDFDSDNLDPLCNEKEFLDYFRVEKDFMVAPNYYKTQEVNLRETAMTRILQCWMKCSSYENSSSENSNSDYCDAFIPYLAMTYFDRFISTHILPSVLDVFEDDLDLFAICCLTIAWKMRCQNFSFGKFMEKNDLPEKYENNVLNMELQILNGLEWRMRAIVAVSFVSFFLEKSSVRGISRKPVYKIITESQSHISFTRFKPSVIAAAAVLLACGFLIREENVGIPAHQRCKDSLIETGYVDKIDLDCCYEKLVDMCVKKNIYVERIEELNLARARPVVPEPTQFASTFHAEEASSSLSHRPDTDVAEVQPTCFGTYGNCSTL